MLTTMTKQKEMGHSARLYFTLLHLANLHFSFQCINVNSSKFNNILVIKVSIIRMYQYVSNKILKIFLDEFYELNMLKPILLLFENTK